MYEYRCKVVKIVDGDTVDVDIDLGFGVWLKKERIRMFGIDTPESRTRDLEEKKYGLAAKKFITEMLDDEGGIVLKTRKDADLASEEVKKYLDWGAGPRASQYLVLGAKAHAALNGKYSPDIEDVKAVALPILRHRIKRNYRADADGVTLQQIINNLL